MARIVLPNDMEVVVVSFGGVATTMLLHFLGDFKLTNSSADLDDMKHLPLPPLTRNPRAKFVYVYGDPRLAVVSLFRRSYHYPQSVKLQRYMGKEAVPIAWRYTLEEYAAEGVDRFYLSEHFHNWYSTYATRVPTMFIRYEALQDHADTLLDFLELPKAALDRFPRQRPRSSDLSQIDPQTRENLEAMYGDFAAELEALDDIEVRQSKRHQLLTVKHLSATYARALVEDAKSRRVKARRHGCLAAGAAAAKDAGGAPTPVAPKESPAAWSSTAGAGVMGLESRGAFQVFFLQSMGMTRKSRMLDIGCGIGQAAKHPISFLEADGYCGVDPDPDCIEPAYATAEWNNLAAKNPSFCVLDDLDLSRVEPGFDYAFAFSVLEHVDAEQRAKFLRTIHAPLKPGGRVYISHAAWLDDSQLEGTGMSLTRRFDPGELNVAKLGWQLSENILPIVELTRQGT